MKAIYLCTQAELAEGCARGFDPLGQGRDTLMVLRWQGELKAWLNRCPHLEVPMHYRKDRFMSADRQHIVCYAHGARFMPDSGLCVLGPCLGQSLRPQTLYVDEHGGVWLAASELACGDRHPAP
ncbi:(2Fe-2S)-binding protein [Pseudomonas syringae pv. syringae PD2774]|uniref:Rieske (2Fe-2S) protein n=1 Tax=Pseudomonas syringae TaxID=317 RepID=UPI0007367B65|nr:Rieske 2Fe-2S domain-containing protein [Pseudomonas syringae]KTB79629.1 (2Fe-2S)-binding protein [Pseudomonas syringae pv. syringae PD2774]